MPVGWRRRARTPACPRRVRLSCERFLVLGNALTAHTPLPHKPARGSEPYILPVRATARHARGRSNGGGGRPRARAPTRGARHEPFARRIVSTHVPLSCRAPAALTCCPAQTEHEIVETAWRHCAQRASDSARESRTTNKCATVLATCASPGRMYAASRSLCDLRYRGFTASLYELCFRGFTAL